MACGAGTIASASRAAAISRVARRGPAASVIGCLGYYPIANRVLARAAAASGARVVREVRGEPARRLVERQARPPRVVLQLVAPDPPDPEVVGVRVPQVEPGDRGGREHRHRL